MGESRGALGEGGSTSLWLEVCFIIAGIAVAKHHGLGASTTETDFLTVLGPETQDAGARVGFR